MEPPQIITKSSHPRKGESFHSRTYRRLFCFVIMPVAALVTMAVHHSHGRQYLTEVTYLNGESRAKETGSSFEMMGITTPSDDAKIEQQRKAEHQDFLVLAKKTNTDKVKGYTELPKCLENNSTCLYSTAERPSCRPWGHFYDTMYNRWLGEYSTPDAKPIQFLEIGFYQGWGFEAFSNFLPTAEKHSMEYSCAEPGPFKEGKWPYENPAQKHSWYESLLKGNRLHCGDASSYSFLKKTWDTYMNRTDAPPLMVVIDDGSHFADHMATSLFFWFPRIQPGGILVVEDIQPISMANKFRTHIVPQLMKDLHWCGGEGKASVKNDPLCFPTISPLLQGIHCEMHICVFVRNNEPAYEPTELLSKMPPNAFKGAQKCLFGPHN